MLIDNFQLLAEYNLWMNQKIYKAAGQLDSATLKQECGAFFGSIFGTLNHNVVGDQLWLTRFLNHPARYHALSNVAELPTIRSLDQTLYPKFDLLQQARQQLDSIIKALCDELRVEDLKHDLVYVTTENEKVSRPFGHLLQHFFNHQTHHRGQLSVLLSQNDLDIGVTDLLELIPEKARL